MFEDMRKYERVFVTGPQRSGTRVCARMIAHDTGFEFVDESKIAYSSVGRAIELCDRRTKFVLHCPALSAFAHRLPTEADLVVFMIRPVEDIEKSQKRIGWKNEGVELSKYGLLPSEGPIAAVKYDNWHRLQKPMVKNWVDQSYDDLKAHPMWVSPEVRKDWNWRQTAKDEFVKRML